MALGSDPVYQKDRERYLLQFSPAERTVCTILNYFEELNLSFHVLKLKDAQACALGKCRM